MLSEFREGETITFTATAPWLGKITLRLRRKRLAGRLWRERTRSVLYLVRRSWEKESQNERIAAMMLTGAEPTYLGLPTIAVETWAAPVGD